jgi:hypothetical protein
MPPRGSFSTTGIATPDAAGAMPAAAYRQYAGEPPTDPTDALPTTGASGTYVDTTATNVVSTLDPSITDLAYDMSWDTGHKATKTLVPWIQLPGLALSKAAIGATCRHRFASYTNTAATRAPLPIAVTLRGRGNGGTQRYVRDTQDVFDILAAAVTAAEGAGCTVYGGGRCAVVTGYSTGGIDTLLALVRRPEGVLAGAVFFPNFDLGYDADDGYYQLVSNTIRADYLDLRVGVRGQGTAAQLDPYMARNAIDGAPRILAIPNSPDLWIFGDETEAPLVPIPSPSRLSSAMRAHPGSAAKTHTWITTSLDSDRVLHDAGVNGAGSILAERRFVRAALDSEEWVFPRDTPPGGVRVFGWMATRAINDAADVADNRPGWELWTGPNANPRSDEPEGGTLHACELAVFDAGKQFLLDVVSSQGDGYYEIVRDDDVRTGTMTNGAKTIVRLNESPVVTSLAGAGFTDVWHSDTGNTGTTTVTAWAAVTGGKTFTASANHPSTATDGNGEQAMRFTAASTTAMILSGLLFDPREDFTLCFAMNHRTGTSNQYLFELRRNADTSAFSVWRSTGTRLSYLQTGGGTDGLAGAIEQPTGSGAVRWVAIRRKSDVMSLSVDGAVLIKSAVTGDSFNTSATVRTILGARLANDGSTIFQWADVDFYAIASAQEALSRARIDAAWAYCKTRHAF